MIAGALRMPVRFLRGSMGRLALTVIALALGIALVCAIDLVNRAVLRAFVEIVDTMAGRAALQVSADGAALLPEDVAATVSAVPGVELAVPVVSATAFMADGSGELLTVHGVDITNEAAVRVYETRDHGGLKVDDPLVVLNQPDSVLLTRSFAGRRRVSVGDALPLITPTGERRFTVRGLLEPEGVARVYGGNFLVMDLFAAEAAFTRPGFINRIDVVVGWNENVARVAAAINAALPAGLRAEPPSQRKADLQKVMQSLQVVLLGVSILALAAAFLIGFNRLTTAFESRIWQLGVLRAVGLSARTVWWDLIKESLILGLGGVAIGIPLGCVLARLLLPAVATTTALGTKLDVPEAQLVIRAQSLVLAGALGIVAALLAAIVPARRAAGQAIAETLRVRGREQPTARPRRMWMVRVGTAAATAAAIGLHVGSGSPGWALAASLGIMATAALAARPLLDAVTAPLARAMSRIGTPSGRFAAATLVHNPRRSALTVATLGAGLGIAVWLSILAQSFERSITDVLPGVLHGDLAVGSTYVQSGFVEASLDERLVSDLQRVPGVAAVAGEHAVDWHYADGPIAINAFDPAYFMDRGFGDWRFVGTPVPDVLSALARGDTVAISSNFALHLHARVGDAIVLDTPAGPLGLRVGGIVEDFLSPRGTILMNRNVYKRYWNDAQVTHAIVHTMPGTAPGAVRSAIASALGRKYGLRILSLPELLEWFAVQVRRAFAGLYVLAALVMLVVLFGVVDTLAASVVERQRGLGAIRALGIRRRQLQSMTVVEALLLGTLGILLALGMGMAMGALWVNVTFPSLIGWVLDLHIPYARLGALAALSVAVCLVAAFLPARRVARLDPAVALRCE